MQIFNYDYFSLINVDVGNWHESFFWPVERETTNQISIDFKKQHQKIVEQLGDTFESDCLLIGYTISTKFIQIINHYLSVYRLESSGYRVHYSDKLRIVPLLLIKNNEITFPIENMWRLVSRTKTIHKIAKWTRSFQFNMKKGTYSIHNHFNAGKCVFVFSHKSITDRKYTQTLPNWVHLTVMNEWLTPGSDASVSGFTLKTFQNIAEGFVDFLKRYTLNKFAVRLADNISKALFEYTTGSLLHIASIYSALLKRVTRIRPRHLLTPTASNTFIRALSLAVRKEGGTVSGFPHGYYICHYSSPRQALHELSTVDEFVAYTPGSVPLFRRNLSINPPARNNPVQIVHENTPLFLNRWNGWKDRPLSERIRTVMVLELSLIPEWAGYHAAESMMNYHFYYSLCKVLSENGYRVIFKKRPKSLSWDGFNIFHNLPNVSVIDEPFENPGLIDQADAVVIQYAMSSTLYWSMCTNKTVIYVDSGWEPWFPDVYDLMSKRCRILHCWYDEYNRPCFNEDELLSILSEPPERPNSEFIGKYLFPEKWNKI